MKKILFALLICSPKLFVLGQGMKPYEGNYLTFKSKAPKITQELRDMTPHEYQSNPEFGVLPYNAPCDNCYELIHKRTDTTKYYVENGTYGGKFYSQTLLGTFHFMEGGFTSSYDGHLQPINNNYYVAKNQDTPTFIDLDEKTTGFIINNERFSFNNNLTLSKVMMDGSEISLGTANWSLKTIGDDGMRIINAWPNIDITVDFGLDKIKTNYIIKNSLGDLSDVKYLKFSDDMILPTGVTIEEGGSELYDDNDNRIGDFILKNQSAQEVFKISAAFGYDASANKEHNRGFFYELESNQLSMFVPAYNWLDDQSLVYPVILDPQVTSTATFTAGIMSFQYNGAWCGLVGSCNYNLIVAKPPNSTITGTTFTAQYETLVGFCAGCWRSEAAFKITSPCGASPAPALNFWNCNTTSAGICSAANVNVFPELGACLGAACNGNVTFQIQNSYCYCATNGNCGNNCQRMPNNTWSMTLIGTNLQTLGNTTTGNGSQVLSPATCSGTSFLNPSPGGGVPGYTYAWSTGATTSTTTVPSYGSSPITCTVTDACGVSRVATFTIICPLGVNYEFITVNKKSQRNVEITWETIEEKKNDFFTVLRSFDGVNFKEINIVKSKGTGNFNYSYLDIDALESTIVYYRLKNTDLSGEEEYSEIFKVDFSKEKTDIIIIPNPSNGEFQVNYDVPYSGEYIINVIDALGNVIFNQTSELKKGNVFLPFDLRLQSKGIFIISITNKTSTSKQRIVIQ